MQRHATNAVVSPFQNENDTMLWNIKTYLEQYYWVGDGVYEFQFLSSAFPLVNIRGPYQFQLIRYTPDYMYNAFQTNINGIINGDGSIEYGGGRRGWLENNIIQWNDGKEWRQVNKVNRKKIDPLNLKNIQDLAKWDSATLGTVLEKYYY
jgi:hypothetical protein